MKIFPGACERQELFAEICQKIDRWAPRRNGTPLSFGILMAAERLVFCGGTPLSVEAGAKVESADGAAGERGYCPRDAASRKPVVRRGRFFRALTRRFVYFYARTREGALRREGRGGACSASRCQRLGSLLPAGGCPRAAAGTRPSAVTAAPTARPFYLGFCCICECYPAMAGQDRTPGTGDGEIGGSFGMMAQIAVRAIIRG